MSKKTEQLGKNLITQEGHDKLFAELEDREKVVRIKIADELQNATEQGDLSENAAYKKALEEKELNELRIEELKEILGASEVTKEEATNTASIGDVVTFKTDEGQTFTMTLVGKAEADPSGKHISIDSPVGSAIFGKKVNDKIKVTLPTGQFSYTIVKIEN